MSEEAVRRCEDRERRKEQLQRQYFGERFVGASLSKLFHLRGYSSGTEADGKAFGGAGQDCEREESIVLFKSNEARFLVIIGPPGTGKTYICSAFLKSLPALCTTFRAYSERDLLERLRKGISEGKGDYLEHLHYLIDDDFVILDDLGSSGHNAWREEVLMEAIDYRYKGGRKTLITSNLTQAQFKTTYGERITSRLFASENTVVSLFGFPDLRTLGY